MTIIFDLLRYLRRPFFTDKRQKFDWAALTQILQLLIFGFILAALVSRASGMVYCVFEGAVPSSTDAINRTRESLWSYVLSAVIIAPLFEELLFRSWIGHRRGLLLILPIALCITAVTAIFIIIYMSVLTHVLILLGTIIGLGFYVKRYRAAKHIAGRHKAAASRAFPYAFWISAVIFGSIHLVNYSLGHFHLSAMILITSQLITGLILSYTRMRYGLWAAMGYHAAFNGLALGFYYWA